MKRYLNPPPRQTAVREYRPVGYVFEHESKRYTIYADCKETAIRVFTELCHTGEINLLVCNP